MSRIAAVMIILSLAACGMKGPLVLPPGPATEPLLGNPKPNVPAKKQPAQTGADVSTDTPTQKP